MGPQNTTRLDEMPGGGKQTQRIGQSPGKKDGEARPGGIPQCPDLQTSVTYSAGIAL